MDKDKTFDIPDFKHIESKERDRHDDETTNSPVRVVALARRSAVD
jgi:hypothetical protein